MNKVITINLHGNAYQLEEAGFEALRAYLENAARSLSGNPDKDEIVADIEQAIADKCRALLSAFKTVVTAREIEQIVAEMGPVETGAGAKPDASDSTGASASTSSGAGTTPPPPADSAASTDGIRRLYRVREGRMLTGVCNGLGAHFGLDPTVIRLVFVLLAFVTVGGMALVYLALTIAVPVAETTAEKAAAHGVPQSTAQDFIRRAKAGYYDATRSFGDKAARREWKRNFKREMRQWRYNFNREMSEQRQHWGRSWAPGPQLGAGWWIALPFLALFRAAMILLLVLGIISLAASGTLFGLAIPAGLPVWLAIVLLIVFYNVVVWPVRALRHALYHPANSGAHYAIYGCFDAIVGLAVAFLLVWYVSHHVPEVRDALHHLPATIRHAIDTIKEWWAGK